MDVLNCKVKLEKQLDVTELDGEKVMIDFESGKYFMIKGSGNDIWDMMEDDKKVSDIVSGLLTIYDVDEQTCSTSVVNFVTKMQNYGFISLHE